jgi:hypothetical protein
MTTTTTTHPDVYGTVPWPTGAVKVRDWHDVGTSAAGRAFDGLSWVIEGDGWHKDDIRVRIQGIQSPTGDVRERVISAGEVHPDTPITAAQARQLAQALIAAADEYDRVSDIEGTVES